MATLIDGKAIAADLRANVAKEAAAFKQKTGVTPTLAVVLVGADPASEVYVRNKSKALKEAGMESLDLHLPETVAQDALLKKISELNADKNVHGILVQLPLPKHISERDVINAIAPIKDVDGFHTVNAGKLATGEEGLVPCTPAGCMVLIKSVLPDLSGKRAVVVGRSNIVGKPMAQLLLAENCTVTVAHSRTKDLAAEVRRADIVVAAVGKPEMIKGDWIAPGAIVIDVGINRVDGKLVGDVDFNAAQHAAAITPVPGGVGPMTIACLIANTLHAARMQNTHS